MRVMTPREGGSDDAETITELIRGAYAEVAKRFGLTAETCPSQPAFTTVDDQRRAIEKGIRYFLLSDGDGPAGCVALDARKPEEAWLARLSVLPGKRRRGHGRTLEESVASEARGANLSELHIGVIADHEELMMWYEKLGFEQVGRRRYDHLPFEALMMKLRLG